MTRSPRRLKQQVQDAVGEQVRDLPLHAVRLAMFGVGRALLLGDRMTRDYKEITEGDGVGPVIGRLRDDVRHTAEKVVGKVVETVRGEEPEPEPRPRARTRPARPAAERGTARTAQRRAADGEISVGKPGAKPAAKPVQDDAPVAEPAPEPKPAEPRPEPEAQAEPAPNPVPEADPTPAPKPEKAEEAGPFEPKPELRPAAPAEAAKAAEGLPVPDYDAATLPQLRARLRGLSADQVKLLREYERKHAARPEVIQMYENRIAKLNGLN
ncbi:hypothetical protein [Actinomadura violacea]|uniref:DUF8129 domain-containing protein n=1 Tax=Actinomadura violacea TaxID=2819934 RepID=A0ABS3S471_9ACTN|nr:hypothetical protein [Actinomadura violacea]MBO2463796.1 hypothetical protein [Actinomadura violacea]